MNRLFVCAILLGLAAYAAATKFTDCGSTTGVSKAVDVTDCPDGQDVCTLKKGTEPTITIKFTSKVDSQKLKVAVHGIVAHVPMPFPMPSDACAKDSGVTCPVKNGESYTYSKGFKVKNSYPSISVGVRFELKDDNGKDLVCIEIPSQIE